MNYDYEEGELSVSEEEKMLFVRKESESNNDEDDDDWDDTELIKEYDRAVAKAKKQVLAKLQTEMGLTKEDVKEVLSDSSSTKKKKKKKKNKKTKPKWDVGSVCRAVYSGDGAEYEAEIIQLLEPSSCIVNYFGYNNQEIVSLSDLKPSLGKRAIDMQVTIAMHDQAALQEVLDEEECSGFCDSQDRWNNNHKKIPLPDKGACQSTMDQKKYRTFRRPLSDQHFFPPPPPPPPITVGESGSPLDDEALNSMLMSWYMCGFYTGYYQRALKDY